MFTGFYSAYFAAQIGLQHISCIPNCPGYDLYATEGTAQAIADAGLPVKRITKKLGEGHPNVIDVVRQGTVGAVVNTVTGDREPLYDGFHIRRAATDANIPCFTSLDTARAAIRAASGQGGELSVRPLVEYRKD